MPPISAVAGKALTIKCPVAGYPIETVTWNKNGVKLPINIWQRVLNGTLTIENVQRSSDQATYSCRARNKHNITSEQQVEVKVLGKKHQFYDMTELEIMTKMASHKLSLASKIRFKQSIEISRNLNLFSMQILFWLVIKFPYFKLL